MRRFAGEMIALAAVLACTACHKPVPSPTTATSAASFYASRPPSEAVAPLPPRSFEELRDLMTSLSEPEKPFHDSFVSNEHSYLQSARALAAYASRGGVYIGVGPEQNFTYIALTRPRDAFIIDVRRANTILHWMYKAIFDLARSRPEFLALLLGRRFDSADALASNASIEDVIARAERFRKSPQDLAEGHARIVERIEHGFGITLSVEDRAELDRMHDAFFYRGLDIRYDADATDDEAARNPTLRELLTARDPSGTFGSFLADEQAFRFVQSLQKQNRIVPIVGSIAGSHTLASLARRIEGRALTVSVFYVSNVEPYLFEDGSWTGWTKNVALLPVDDRSVFLRAQLDSEHPHPMQLRAYPNASVLQPIQTFKNDQGRYRNALELASDCLPDAPLGALIPPFAPTDFGVAVDDPVCGTTPDAMACIPAGPFVRGVDHDSHRCEQPGQPEDRASSSTPAMTITLDTFYLDRTEVTNEAYGRCVARGQCASLKPRYPGFDDPEEPVTGVSWFDADAYCHVVGKRLPTEAEWEKAARGPNGDTHPWGNAPATCARAVIQEDGRRACGRDQPGEMAERGRIWPVGSKGAGRYGLYDMIGNAEEWVADWWTPSWSECGAACAGKNPKGPPPCPSVWCANHEYKVLRGGSWFWPAEHATGYHRRRHVPSNNPFHHVGFRCALAPASR
jgi:formylglycine-generating enzyme required for sulfatase activity